MCHHIFTEHTCSDSTDASTGKPIPHLEVTQQDCDNVLTPFINLFCPYYQIIKLYSPDPCGGTTCKKAANLPLTLSTLSRQRQQREDLIASARKLTTEALSLRYTIDEGYPVRVAAATARLAQMKTEHDSVVAEIRKVEAEIVDGKLKLREERDGLDTRGFVASRHSTTASGSAKDTTFSTVGATTATTTTTTTTTADEPQHLHAVFTPPTQRYSGFIHDPVTPGTAHRPRTTTAQLDAKHYSEHLQNSLTPSPAPHASTARTTASRTRSTRQRKTATAAGMKFVRQELPPERRSGRLVGKQRIVYAESSDESDGGGGGGGRGG